MVARVKGPEYCSLRAEEIEGIIEDLEQEISRKRNDFEQKLGDLRIRFAGLAGPGPIESRAEQ